MKKTIFAFCCLLLSGQLKAQNPVIQVSKIIEADGSPVANAVLYCNGQFAVISDEKGAFPLISCSSQIKVVVNGVERGFTTDTVVGSVPFTIRLKPLSIEEILVSSSRADEITPIASVRVKKSEIAIQNTGRDLPILLQFQPGVTITSDAGAGVGYTGIRVRGSDATRTNVTVNGVPINDAESHGTFWVNMPDISSSLSSIQIQSGAGSSTNGPGAFGASLNMQTASEMKAYARIGNSIGSFNTARNSIAAGTGLINNRWTADLRLSSIRSDGYVDRASSDLKSWMFSLGYHQKNRTIKLLAFGGKEKTYQAWWGVPIEKYSGTQQELANHYARNVGVAYKTPQDSVNLFGSNPGQYNYYTYQNETDNYTQNHYHLYLNQKTGRFSNFNATLFYTRGFGYFEQFKPNDRIINYGFAPWVQSGDTITRSDVVRQRWLDNHLYGVNATWSYRKQNVDFITGISYSHYNGDHYGKVVWANLLPAATPGARYYHSTGQKTDANAFAKLTLKLASNTFAWVDMQYRTVNHTGRGNDNDLRKIGFNGKFGFFNPKAGVTRVDGKHRYYASVSTAQREPSRSDFTDNRTGEIPKPEKLTDFEAGWNYSGNKVQAGINLYYMHYRNQLVLTGEVNDVGTALRRNVNESHRAGVEISFEKEIIKYISFGGNATLSQNRIREMVNVIPDYATYINNDTVFRNVPIAMSPSVIAAGWLKFQLPSNFEIRWMHKYTGRQYLDNTGDKYRSLNPFYFNEIWLNKGVFLKNGGKIDLQFQVLNVFNARYASNGYTFMYTYGTPDITQEVFVYPQAGRHFMLGVNLSF